MKHTAIFTALLFSGIATGYQHDLPPSDTTPHERLSPHEHAMLYLNLVEHLYLAIIPQMEAVTQTNSSTPEQRRTIIALYRRLNMAIDHMEHNPDMRREVLSILRQNPQRRQHLEQQQQVYIQSATRCKATGLIPDMPNIRRITIPTEP
ncbi:MAG: hypothetical protein E7033_07195 [Akkermansiaceae bacterium]|nr:hypothetical protein [Akkermansiaceae bacterium]